MILTKWRKALFPNLIIVNIVIFVFLFVSCNMPASRNRVNAINDCTKAEYERSLFNANILYIIMPLSRNEDGKGYIVSSYVNLYIYPIVDTLTPNANIKKIVICDGGKYFISSNSANQAEIEKSYLVAVGIEFDSDGAGISYIDFFCQKCLPKSRRISFGEYLLKPIKDIDSK